MGTDCGGSAVGVPRLGAERPDRRPKPADRLSLLIVLSDTLAITVVLAEEQIAIYSLGADPLRVFGEEAAERIRGTRDKQISRANERLDGEAGRCNFRQFPRAARLSSAALTGTNWQATN